MITSPARESSTGPDDRSPISTGTAFPARTIPVSTSPMKLRKSPIPTAKARFIEGLIESASQRKSPDSAMSRKSAPLTKTAPIRSCQPIPSVAMPKAMKAFSPMYGATAIGRLAASPIRIVPSAAVRIVASVEGPVGIPALARIAGLTTMM